MKRLVEKRFGILDVSVAQIAYPEISSWNIIK